MPHYCDLAPGHPVHDRYHAEEYGFPVTDESILFERLALEVMQAGLSWEIVLKKRAALREAFHGYDVPTLASWGEAEVGRLLATEGIIRNRLKIQAVLANAGTVLGFRATHGGFAGWLAAQGSPGKEAWVKLFRRTFRFMGPEIVGEFLMSIGLLPGAHRPDCPVQARLKPRR